MHLVPWFGLLTLATILASTAAQLTGLSHVGRACCLSLSWLHEECESSNPRITSYTNKMNCIDSPSWRSSHAIFPLHSMNMYTRSIGPRCYAKMTVATPLICQFFSCAVTLLNITRCVTKYVAIPVISVVSTTIRQVLVLILLSLPSLISSQNYPDNPPTFALAEQR